MHEPLDTIALSHCGTVYTHTTVYQGLPEFAAPYVLAYVDLPEGVRVLGQVGGVGVEEALCGREVELRLESYGQDREGHDLIGHRFYPRDGVRRA